MSDGETTETKQMAEATRDLAARTEDEAVGQDTIASDTDAAGRGSLDSRMAQAKVQAPAEPARDDA